MKSCSNEYQEAHKKRVEDTKASVLKGQILEKMCLLLKVLGEPSRMKIALALLNGELCVYHIVDAVAGNQSAVSHQLRILKDSGAISCRREGQNILYSIADSHVREIIEVAKAHAYCESENKL